MVRFILSRPIHPEAMGFFNYSSGDCTLLMGVLKKVYGSKYERLPWKNFFDPLGAKGAVFEMDSAGTFVGGCYAFLSTVDLAKVGQLILDDGVWNGKRLLPESWVTDMKKPFPGQINVNFSAERWKSVGAMGTVLWTNAEFKGVPEAFPAWPKDAIMSIEFWGKA